MHLFGFDTVLFPIVALATSRPSKYGAPTVWCQRMSIKFASPQQTPALKKKREHLITRIYPVKDFFALQFSFNSEKSPPGEITIITVLY